MRSFLIPVAALLPAVLACSNADTDACAAVFVSSSAALAAFCATYTTGTVTATTAFPTVAASACEYKSKKFSSACSCFITGATTTTSTTSSKTTSTTLATCVKSTSSCISSTSTTSATKAATTTSVGSGGTTCTVTAYASISSAVKSCSNIVLSNVSAPPSSTINLQSLQTGATVIFAGTTTFGYTDDSDFDPIVISGTDVTITGATGHIIDGNGQAYWDGLGSNGGVNKPDHFIVLKKMYNSKVTNLNIRNWPVHCFNINGNQNLALTNINLDNSAGDSPNSASGTLAAAHNSDGFDISASDYVTLDGITVHNQDDCVAVTSGTHITVNNAYCYGGHGLSIGSIGGKSNNTVDTVVFSNSQVVSSENGARIKSNSGTTGSVKNVTYQNITLTGIATYGIDIQQDYLNGGATGTPTNGVTIAGVHFIDVTGTVTGSSGYNYYILCGSGSCSDFTYSGVKITGGAKGGSCNYPSSGCPS